MADRRASRTVPVALGLAMLAVVVAAGLFPNAGTVRADTNCPYGGCSTSSALPLWELTSILVIIAAVAIAAALILLRRRRPPTTPVQAWKQAPPAGAGTAVEGPAGPTAPYIETPEDVGHAPPPVPATRVAAGAAVAAPAAAEGEPDIDSLMAELDRISGEILKKPSKKGASTGGEDLGEGGQKGA